MDIDNLHGLHGMGSTLATVPSLGQRENNAYCRDAVWQGLVQIVNLLWCVQQDEAETTKTSSRGQGSG